MPFGAWIRKVKLVIELQFEVGPIDVCLSAPLRAERLSEVSSGAVRIPVGSCRVLSSHPDVQELRQALHKHSSIRRSEQSGGQLRDEVLLRWLRCKGSVEAATQELLRHVEWRAQMGIIRKETVANELAAEKVFLQGCDMQGRPVIIVLAARHSTSSRDLDETKRLIIFTLETATLAADIKLNQAAQILCIFDLSDQDLAAGLGLGNLDTQGLKAVFEVLQQQFPECLSELWFLNAPFIFWGLWKIVSPFIQPATKHKIRFLSGHTMDCILKDSLASEVLPVMYGGKASMIPIESAAQYFKTRSLAPGGNARPAADYKEGRLAGFKRSSGQAILLSWRFAKAHNPIWAAKVFGRTGRKVAQAIPRPGWLARREGMLKPAKSLSLHVQQAWKNRPNMPRPSYRFHRSPQALKYQAYIDLGAFYLIMIALAALAVIWLPRWMGIEEANWRRMR